MKEKCLIVFTTIYAILSCIAIGYSDTTLVPISIPSRIAWLNYIVTLFMILVLLNKGVQYTRLIKYRLTVIFFVSILKIFHTYNGGLDIMNILGAIPLLAFCFVDDEVLLKAFRLYRKVLIIISITAIAIYIDFFAIHVLPNTTVPFYGSDGFYVNYYISYISLGEDGIRSCGFFNEPGFFGTILALYLISDKINLKDIGNVIMLIAGITTWSMAFWALMGIGVFLHILKTWKLIIIAVCLLLGFMIVVNTVEFSNPAVSSLVERFQYDPSKGSFKGDNRTTYEFDAFYERFQETGNILFGNGTGFYGAQQFEHVSSYKSAILDWGYVGFFFTYILLIILAIKASNKNRTAIIFVLCFAISIYQRSGIFSMVYILTLFGGIAYNIERKKIYNET